MSARLPEFVDPWLLAERGRSISGEFELVKLPRMTEVLIDTGGSVCFALNFSKDAKSRVRITGYVRAGLRLECQRCLEVMLLAVDSTLDLVVIQVPAEAERIPPECEPVLVEDGGLRIVDLIEEELLLAIPLVPMHEPGICTMCTSSTDESVQLDASTESGTVNPFAILSQLKTDRKN
ncbi:MAG: DUF177 domain-containing protein [Chromatiaceae bacterium]|nr:DUF177 domain-containing protein [Chromatiaceae bacterium]MCP5409422.1 DUF177 domain-containing protein [Chromatiaceae bacterium]